MGLNISIERKANLLPASELEAKLKIAKKVLEFQRPYFSPKALESWSIAPLESLGGKLLRQVSKLGSDLESMISEAKYSLTEAPWDSDFLSFKILGDWTIGRTRINGYLTVHNKEWRSTYGDIESNIYPTREFSDLVYFLKTDHDAESRLVSDFLREFPAKIYRDTPKVSRIYFGLGAPSRFDVDSLIGAYYSSDTAFIKDCIYTAIEEQGDPMRDSFYPYKESFIVGGLNEVPSFEGYLDELFGKHSIKKDTSGSVTLLGSDMDSFKLLFDEIYEEILKPLAERLPNRKALLDKIRDAIVQTTTKQTKLGFG